MSPAQDVILLVEDNPDDRHLLTRAFKKAGVEVPIYCAEDGEKAVTFLRELSLGQEQRVRPVLILLDLKLPRLSGFEVLEWLKQQDGLRRIPVVVLTSSDERADVERAYDLGANSYLVKPGRTPELQVLVARIDNYWLELNVGSSVGR